MGKSCCIEGCTVSSDNVEYFKFPVARALRESWLAACGAAGEVCSAHFAADDYKCTRTGRRLRPDAVPSLLLAKSLPSKPNNEDNSDITDKNVETNDKVSDNEKLEVSTETSIDDAEEAIDREREKAKSKRDDSSLEAVDTRQVGLCVKENGKKESIVNVQHEDNDIENMITNYQIKQTKTLADRLNPEPLEDLIPSIMSDQSRLDEISGKLTSEAPKAVSNDVTLSEWDGQLATRLASQLASKLDSQLDGMLGAGAPPIFIEVPVTKDVTNSRAASPEDCLMVLESVQCDIDPSSLMLPEHGPETDSDMEIVSVDRKEDPISLLTSSDEDEVIIEEPHIDTVEVSDETDEDDRPLQTLIQAKTEKVKTEKNYVWGMYQFYCVQCDYKTFEESAFKKHMVDLEHSTAIQICPVCNYTTASKAQYSRHKRKHKDERNYRCHLCNYKARHNMSLIYHLKSHNAHAPAERSPKFTCDKCGFSSHLKSEGMKHIKVCDEGGRLACDLCNYSTKRRSDLRRHRMRRHSVDDEDEDFRA